MTRPNLRNLQVKENDLVLLVYDDPTVSRGALVLGQFKEFYPIVGQCSWFRADPGITFTASENFWFSWGPENMPELNIGLRLPQFRKGTSDSKYMTSAERIYIGRKEVKKALSEDPIAKYLLTNITI